MSVCYTLFQPSLVPSFMVQSLKYHFEKLVSSQPSPPLGSLGATYSSTQNKQHYSSPSPMTLASQKYMISAVNILQGWYKTVWHSLTHLPFFFTPEVICLRDSLKLSMTPQTFQKGSIPFTGGQVKEHGKNSLNYLNLVKDILQTCKG